MPRECTATILHALYDSVQALKILPNETANTRVVRMHLVQSVFREVASHRSVDRNIVDIGDCGVRNFGLQNVCDVFVEYGDGVGPSHR